MASKLRLPKFDKARIQNLADKLGERAKMVREQASNRGAELVQFSKDNLEALKASRQIVTTGAKAVVQDVVANGRRQRAALAESRESLRGVKSPKVRFQLQRDAAKSQLEAARADTKALGQSVAKLAGDAVQPLKSRVAVVTKRAAPAKPAAKVAKPRKAAAPKLLAAA